MPITRAYASASQPGNFFVAGKNKIINGDFGIWQRGTSWAQSTFQSEPYTADRFCFYSDTTNGTRTVSRQTFTPGTAPVAGYEGKFFWRYQETVAGAASQNSVSQRIEDVQTFAGQTVTVSYWAKADAARSITVNVWQQFGTGGSTRVDTAIATPTLTTSWVRYSHTVNIPSISGKTIGTNSSLQFNWYFPTNTTQTIDIWGVQVEAGSVATPFTTATGTLAGELAACQRYCYVINGSTSVPVNFNAAYYTSTRVFAVVPFPVTMRSTPSTTISSQTMVTVYSNGGNRASTAIAESDRSTQTGMLDITTAATTAGHACMISFVTASTSITWSAEL